MIAVTRSLGRHATTHFENYTFGAVIRHRPQIGHFCMICIHTSDISDFHAEHKESSSHAHKMLLTVEP